MKRLLSLLLLVSVLTVALFTTSCGDSDMPPTDAVYTVVMEVQDYGNITMELHAQYAPYTVDNFITLVRQGFYDGLTFHRVIQNFMIQGGDPLGNGTGDSGKDIVGEFALNGHTNTLSHKRGVVSMARSGARSYESLLSQFDCTIDNFEQNTNFMQILTMYYGITASSFRETLSGAFNSGSCQFFIVHEDSTYLDGSYASFGFVTEGMDVVDKIASVSTDENDKPTSTVTITRMYVVEQAQ